LRRINSVAKRRRTEDEADRWLREHDPYYSSTKKNKRRKVRYPYDTPEQEHRRRQTEIPLSNLNSRQRRAIKGVLGSYDEDGEFNL
jgi:hypothetical protein